MAPGKPRFLTNWCHGAPGIALGRLAILHLVEDASLHEELRIGLETTRRLHQTQLDHLCCGNMGRVEILSHAARTLDQENLMEASVALTAQVLARAEARGSFGWLPENEERRFDPAFFTGAAGVGYALLRLARPDQLPCVLLLE
jgi:lantibiotic modifying enzyme